MPPGDGVPFEFALTWYFDDRDVVRRFMTLRNSWWKGGSSALTQEQQCELGSLRSELILDLLTKLRAGQLVASGFRHGKMTEIDISARWWWGCELLTQFDDSADAGYGTRFAAEAHGTRFVGIWVYENIGNEPVETAAPPATTWPPERTGAPGAPTTTTMYLIEQEFERRVANSQTAATLADEARELRQWSLDQYPDRPPPKETSIENRIRDRHRRATKPTEL